MRSASGLFACAVATAFLMGMEMPARGADLVIAMPNWPSGQATANILKVGLAKEFNLDAEVREVGGLTAFKELESGDVDIYAEVWRPNLDSLVKTYVTEKGAVALTKRGVPAWQGLCATSDAAALGIKSVNDLLDPAKTAALDTDGDGQGELWIGSPAWSSTEIERVKANSYGYVKNLTLVEAEEDVAMAAVDAAVATGRPMVFYCYAPHHVFELHKVVRLTEPPYDPAKWKIASREDPLWISKSSAPVAWDAAHFYIAYSTAFGKKHPEVVRFLEQADFSPDEVTRMTYALQVERQEPLSFARSWVNAHETRVDRWAKP